jgi:site-specific recombinase XerD
MNKGLPITIYKQSDSSKDGKRSIWFFWDQFSYMYLRTGRSEVTVKSVKSTLKFITSNTSIFSIEDLNNPRLVEDSLFHLKEVRGFSNCTYNSYRKNIGIFLNWLEKYDYLSVNNIHKVEKCKSRIVEQLVLKDEDIALVITHIRTQCGSRLLRLRNGFFIDLLRFTGARLCELMDLKVSNITKLKNGEYRLVISGRKQKGRNRYYRLDSWVRDSYLEYMEYRNKLGRKEDNLFISQSKRTGWTSKGVTKFLRRMSKEIGVNVTSYGFRRYVATKLYLRGVELRQIADYLGHTRLTTTMRYVERCSLLTENCGKVLLGCVDEYEAS